MLDQFCIRFRYEIFPEAPLPLKMASSGAESVENRFSALENGRFPMCYPYILVRSCDIGSPRVRDIISTVGRSVVTTVFRVLYTYLRPSVAINIANTD